MTNQQTNQAGGQSSLDPASTDDNEQALLNDLLTGRCGPLGALAIGRDYGLQLSTIVEVVRKARAQCPIQQ